MPNPSVNRTRYIKRFYNRQRSHSYADGLSPATYAESLSKSLN